MAVNFGIAPTEEARAYWLHEILGIRLKECVSLVLAVRGKRCSRIKRPMRLPSRPHAFESTAFDMCVRGIAQIQTWTGLSPITMRVSSRRVAARIF